MKTKQQKRVSKQPRDDIGRFASIDRRSSAPRVVSVRHEGKTYKIPVNSRGHVPKEALAARFLAIEEEGGKRRNISVDAGITAKTVLSAELTPQEAAPWWANPNLMDIEGIDTEDGILIPNGTKVVVIGDNPESSDIIQRYMSDNFTKKEIMEATRDKPLVYFLSNQRLPFNMSGGYDHISKDILIDPNYLNEPSTFVHETLHAIKHAGSGDRGKITRTHIMGPITGESRDYEEAVTVAETVARCTPYNSARVSYYSEIEEDLEDARALMNKDRKLFTGNAQIGSKGKKGKRAIDAVESKFMDSEIVNLQSYGDVTVKQYLDNPKHK